MTTQSAAQLSSEPNYYNNGFEHLVDELHKLDLIIARRVAFFRHHEQRFTAAAKNQGIYISDQEVDGLLTLDTWGAEGGDSVG